MLRPFARVAVEACLALTCLMALGGCSSESRGMGETLRALNPLASDPTLAPLKPGFRYLRVTVNGEPSIWVLGYVEPDAKGPIEVWYSTRREVLRLQDGRITETAGLPVNWVRTSHQGAPGWHNLAQDERPMQWQRTRDLMPGYRFNIEDSLTLARTAPPATTSLVGVEDSTLRWFEERTAGNDLPPARFALERTTPGPGSIGRPTEGPIYGEQCLADALCLSWQRWPPARAATP